MGKAAIYNPYLDTLGGGEKYTLSFAKVLSEDLGFDVDIQWFKDDIKDKLGRRFHLNLPKNIKIVKDVNRGEGYDLVFWVSDGSVPTLRAKNNYLHFQVPFKGVNGSSLINKMKFFRIKKVICNSHFTKKVIDLEYGVNSEVLYPPVDTKLFKPKRKENLICYIGRFSDLVQNKGHMILIEEFKKLTKDVVFKEWKLVLAGGTEVGSQEYLSKLKRLIKNYNIQIIESPSYQEIIDIYARSKFFWSAAGYGINEDSNPEKTEHFGITLVEAMASGAVPLVLKSGGAKEIIEDKISGFFWDRRSQLMSLTKDIINKPLLLRTVSKKAIERSNIYSYEEFRKKVKQII